MSKTNDLPGGIKRTGKVTPQTIDAIRSKLEKVVEVLKEKGVAIESEEIMKLVYSLNPKVPIFNIYHDGLLEVLESDDTFIQVDGKWSLAELQQSASKPASNGVLSQDEIAKLFADAAPTEEVAPAVEEIIPPCPAPSSNAQLSQDDIANLIASMTATEEVKPEPVTPKPEPKSSGVSLSQGDIAALISSMTADKGSNDNESVNNGEPTTIQIDEMITQPPSTGAMLSQDEIANLFASVSTEEAETEEDSTQTQELTEDVFLDENHQDINSEIEVENSDPSEVTQFVELSEIPEMSQESFIEESAVTELIMPEPVQEDVIFEEVTIEPLNIQLAQDSMPVDEIIEKQPAAALDLEDERTTESADVGNEDDLVSAELIPDGQGEIIQSEVFEYQQAPIKVSTKAKLEPNNLDYKPELFKEQIPEKSDENCSVHVNTGNSSEEYHFSQQPYATRPQQNEIEIKTNGSARCSVCMARWDGPLRYCPNCGVKIANSCNLLKFPVTARGKFFEVTILGIEKGFYRCENDYNSLQFVNIRFKNIGKQAVKLDLADSFSIVDVNGIQIDSAPSVKAAFTSYNEFLLYPGAACFKSIPFFITEDELRISKAYWRYHIKEMQCFEEYIFA